MEASHVPIPALVQPFAAGLVFFAPSTRDGNAPLLRPFATITLAKGVPPTLSFNPQGKTLATPGGDKTVKLWDPGTGKEIATLTGHPSWVMGAYFSGDGKILVSHGSNHIKVWNAVTRKEKTSFEAPRDADSLAVSPNGALLAVSGIGCTTEKTEVNVRTGQEK